MSDVSLSIEGRIGPAKCRKVPMRTKLGQIVAVVKKPKCDEVLNLAKTKRKHCRDIRWLIREWALGGIFLRP